MRLAGERVTLLPVPRAVSVAVVSGRGLAEALDEVGLTAAPGWPHADTGDALRALAPPAGPDPAHGTFLITVGAQVVGDCGWLGGPDGDGAAEIGYGLAGPARGRGLGTEAVGVLAAWVERQPGVRLVTADAHVGNEASRRLLARLGFLPSTERPPYTTYVRGAPHLDAPGQ